MYRDMNLNRNTRNENKSIELTLKNGHTLNCRCEECTLEALWSTLEKMQTQPFTKEEFKRVLSSEMAFKIDVMERNAKFYNDGEFLEAFGITKAEAHERGLIE
jgi:hypothetical protein